MKKTNSTNILAKIFKKNPAKKVKKKTVTKVAKKTKSKIAKKTKVTSFIPLHSKLQKLLDKYTLSPLLSLDMRLGEGSGAAMGIGIAQAAIKLYQNMATFQSAGISGKSDGSVQS